jgi:transposase
MGWLRLFFPRARECHNAALATLQPWRQKVMTTTTIIGMDISKYSFELCGTDERGRHTLHRRLHRDKVSLFFANLPTCTVAMESCSGSQHWAR